MDNLSDRMVRLKQLYEKYGLSAQPLEDDLRQLESFRIVVPVLGSFNTGKSALLNALLGRAVLPTGITAERSVPTEIVAGDDLLTIYREDTAEFAELSALRSGALDPEGIERLRLECDCELLRRFPDVMLVDLPGLDSGIEANEIATRRYLARSQAYLLVFSADEPVIKQSLTDFLSELRLYERPVFAVLTKCDKVLPQTSEQARLYLQKSLASQLVLPDVEVYRIQAGPQPDVQPVAQLLVRLQRCAEELRSQEFSGRLRRAARSAEGYLEMRLLDRTLTTSELEGRIGRIQDGMERLFEALDQNAAHFSGLLEQSEMAAKIYLREGMLELSPIIEAALAAGESPQAQVDGILRELLTATVHSEIDPVLQRYGKSMRELLALHQQAEPEHTVSRPPAELPAVATVETVLRHFTGSAAVFDQLFSSQSRFSLKLAALRKRLVPIVQGQVLPELERLVDTCIAESVAEYSEQYLSQVSAPALEELAFRRNALEDLRREKLSGEQAMRHSIGELQADLALVRELSRS
ncbi:dynamin family protein [Ligaoa zhengdingensis]|uniref:dynamin family protein n=2 Tax=Ligaoa zhengdingensis TaxID=2763658 RepID=UPI0031BA9CD1